MSDRVTLPPLDEYPIITVTQEDIDNCFKSIKTHDEKVNLSQKFRAYQEAGRFAGKFVVPMYE